MENSLMSSLARDSLSSLDLRSASAYSSVADEFFHHDRTDAPSSTLRNDSKALRESGALDTEFAHFRPVMYSPVRVST